LGNKILQKNSQLQSCNQPKYKSKLFSYSFKNYNTAATLEMVNKSSAGGRPVGAWLTW